jgi:hypothetical protein
VQILTFSDAFLGSGLIEKGEKFSRAFKEAGEYADTTAFYNQSWWEGYGDIFSDAA